MDCVFRRSVSALITAALMFALASPLAAQNQPTKR
jgi:hypothetical protein